MSDHTFKRGGKYWGAEYGEVCEGHRKYIWKGRLSPGEEVDLCVSPEGEEVQDPPPVTECPLCLKKANAHGHGIHSVGVYGCPNCGSEIEHKQSRGSNSVMNYTRCYECAPKSGIVHWLRGLFE